jgi:hypothetical protein
MAFILRFVQRYRADSQAEFLKLEALFAEMERRRAELPQGRRRRPFAGREPTNTLIWECEFPTLAAAQAALARLAGDKEHQELFARQSPYMLEAWTEIDEIILD